MREWMEGMKKEEEQEVGEESERREKIENLIFRSNLTPISIPFPSLFRGE